MSFIKNLVLHKSIAERGLNFGSKESSIRLISEAFLF